MKIKAKIRHTPGVMNKLEAEYARVLDAQRAAGEIQGYMFERVTLKLADNCRYTPDFMVLLSDDTIRFAEVKGFWRDDARVKIKVAAAQLPMFEFIAVRKRPKKDGGGWVTETIRTG